MRETVLGPCYGSPALADWDGQLALAWVDGEGGSEIFVAVGAVAEGIEPGEEFAPSQASTGFQSPSGSVALAAVGSRLLLAWVDPESNLLAAVDQGGGFGAPVWIASEVLGGVAAAARRRFDLAWRTSGNQVMIAGSDDGLSFDSPTAINHSSFADPGVAIFEHPYHGEMLAMTVDDSGSRTLTAIGEQLSELDEPGEQTGIGSSGTIAMTPTRAPVGSGAGLVLIYRDGDRVAFWNADLDLELYGGNPRGPESAFAPAGLGWGGDLIVAYVETPIDQRLRVGSWTSVFGIPPELANRVGEPCDPRACTDDPRLVCVLTGRTEVKNQDARISNARAGDIILTPADGEGVIGTILKALEPPEFFDHMGLMVRDYEEIRHCTEAKDRLMKDKDYFTGSLLGDPAPTDGLRPDLVKYGWPGPITQSVQDGFFDGWNDGRNPAWDHHELAKAIALGQVETLSEDRRRAFFDKENPDKPFRITNLTLTPTYREDYPEPLYPLVVRPPRQAEERFPWVRWALGRVVAEANRTTGHYRFYAYTDATIATDLSRFAPDPGDSSWDRLPEGADWAAGTPGIVCSTFVWLAAVRALADLHPSLFLDQDEQLPQDGSARAQPPPKVDGLFTYFESERATAGVGLHDWIVDSIERTVKQAIDEGWPMLARIGAGVLVGILTGVIAGPAAGVVAGAVAAAALSPATMDEIAIGLTQMPEQVANGVCNAFANDRPEDRGSDDTAWKSPGGGLSVSPDNIWTFWDPPADHRDVRSGLWGSSERAMLANPRPELVETGTLAISPGVCTVRGYVVFAGERIVGAEVFIGCRKTLTDIEGQFELRVPADGGSARQLIRAQAYWDRPPGMLTRKLEQSLPVGDLDVGGIELDPPPEWRRRVEMHGELVMVHQVLIGHDTIDHHHFSNSLFVQADPGIISADPMGAGLSGSKRSFDEATEVCGGEKAHWFGTLRVLDQELDGLPGVPPRPPGAEDLSVVVDWTYEILDGEDQVDSQAGTLVVPPGQADQLSPSLNDGDVPPDRAHSQITIENLVNPA